jgi:hypothetical protein
MSKQAKKARALVDPNTRMLAECRDLLDDIRNLMDAMPQLVAIEMRKLEEKRAQALRDLETYHAEERARQMEGAER